MNNLFLFLALFVITLLVACDLKGKTSTAQKEPVKATTGAATAQASSTKDNTTPPAPASKGTGVEVKKINPNQKSFRIAFYNVENLFDIYDDPTNDGDNEYLPGTEKNWSNERYQNKLDQLGRALLELGEGEAPVLIGLSEIENAMVMRDLSKRFTGEEFGWVQYDSQDKRGIDVGLLYNKAVFTPKESEPLTIDFSFEKKEYTSRDILYVNGDFKGESIHLFVCHWPSRRGGLAVSEPRRVAAAKVTRQKIDAVLAKDADAKIVLMGDFNDEPNNKSMERILKAALSPDNLSKGDLFNAAHAINTSTVGTYNYQGQWNMLDQIVFSNGLLNAQKGLSTSANSMGIYKADWMLYTDKKHGKRPSKTYGRSKYYGGVSDHLPIYMTVEIK